MNDDERKEQEETSEKEQVSKAFGNEPEKPETKPEENTDPKPENTDKGKPKKEDPESDKGAPAEKKTYTQAEVDAMLARARKKYQKGATDESPEEGEPEQPAQPEESATTGISMDKYIRAELKGSMAMFDIAAKKLGRAAMLIEPESVMDNGVYSEEKAKQEIEKLLQEWPELKRAEVGSENNDFSFGAPRQDENAETTTASKVSQIFGNK